jgi:uncharacterized RDD family membrane protein YckC
MSDSRHAVSRNWPGERFGLPESGPRSIARFGRRLGGVAIDWGIASGLSLLLFPKVTADPQSPWLTPTIFGLLQVIFLLFFNGSIGHLLLRMRVVPITGGATAPWRLVVRTALLCLGIPALIWDRDQRGLHDRLAGTVLVRV